MSQSTFWCMALMIVVLWVVALRGAYVLRRVAAERDTAKATLRRSQADSWYWKCRALDIESDAQLAWYAYHAIGWGTSGAWNENDRWAFKRLEETLDRYNLEGKVR